VIVPDVNLLVHAMNAESEHHERAWSWWSSTWAGTEHRFICTSWTR
jgi:predicted nucleic acid-binding protein